VKEEDEIQVPWCRLRSSGDITIREPKVKVKEEKEQDKVVALPRQQRLNTISDDPSDTPGFNTTFMALLIDYTAWARNIDDTISLSICESGRPLVDLTHDDDEAGPSGTVKEEPAKERIDPYGHFCHYSKRIKHIDCRFYFKFNISSIEFHSKEQT
jgi:hypothetical protein